MRITSVSPIAGALSGGFDVTITGTGFQAGAEVFFGTVASTGVHVLAVNQVTARVPQATETGTVRVSLVNPDGATAELTSGFTDEGPEVVFQPPFDADYCLNALDSSNQNIPIVVSDQCPTGFPAAEELTVADPDKGEDHLRAMFKVVNPGDGSPLPNVELRDVTEFGY